MTMLTSFHNRFYLQMKIFGNKSTAYNIITEISNVFIRICLKCKFSSASISNVGRGHSDAAIANIFFNIGQAGTLIWIQGSNSRIMCKRSSIMKKLLKTLWLWTIRTSWKVLLDFLLEVTDEILKSLIFIKYLYFIFQGIFDPWINYHCFF